jgi:hypothetical protein
VITEIRNQRGTIDSTVRRSAAARTAAAARSTGIGRGRRRVYACPALDAKPVSSGPKFTTDTVIPSGASSAARARPSPSTACFVAE